MWHPFSASIDEVAIPEAAAHAPILVIHLWADWNGYDLEMDRRLRTLSLEFQDKIEFRSLDTEGPENQEFLASLS